MYPGFEYVGRVVAGPMNGEFEAEAKTSGLTKTQLLHEAIRDLLYRRACERDAELYAALPLRREETKLWATETWPKDEPGTDWEAVFES